jgi:hypothetical protein
MAFRRDPVNSKGFFQAAGSPILYPQQKKAPLT